MRSNYQKETDEHANERGTIAVNDRLKEVRIVNHTGEGIDKANRRSFAVRNTHFKIFVNLTLLLLASAMVVLVWDTKRQFDEKKAEVPQSSQNCLEEYEANRCNENSIQLLEVCSKLLECINQPELKSEISLTLLLADNMNKLFGGLSTKTLVILMSLIIVSMVSCALLSTPPTLDPDFGPKLTN